MPSTTIRHELIIIAGVLKREWLPGVETPRYLFMGKRKKENEGSHYDPNRFALTGFRKMAKWAVKKMFTDYDNLRLSIHIGDLENELNIVWDELHEEGFLTEDEYNA